MSFIWSLVLVCRETYAVDGDLTFLVTLSINISLIQGVAVEETVPLA